MNVWSRPSRPVPGTSRVLFLDRDGVVVVDKHYLSDPREVELSTGAAAAMARAREAGFLLVGLSNQSGLGRGLFSPGDLDAVMTRLDELLTEEGAAFDAFHYCPHAPADGCACRKPATGLLDEAAATIRWDPTRSWMIGDKADDVGLAVAADLGAVLVRTGYGTEQEAEVRHRWPGRSRLLFADDLAAAIAMILAEDRA